MIRLIIKLICAVLGWLYRYKSEADMVSAYIEYGIDKLTYKYNNIIDHKRNKYFERHKSVRGSTERYPYITSHQYLYGSAVIHIVEDISEG